MRRWIEFGYNGNLAVPKFYETSNTTKRHHETQSSYPPIFLSMPFKADLLNVLQGTSLADFDHFSHILATIDNGGSTDAPAADCTAEHVVSAANPEGWKVNQFYTAGFWQMFIGGFPKPAGGFTSPLLTISFDPPSKNG